MADSEDCLQCGTAMVPAAESVRYTNLPNVVLANVRVHRCPECGEQEAEIERMIVHTGTLECW